MIGQRARRLVGIRRVAVVLVALAVAVGGAAGMAGATVPDRSIRHTYVDLNQASANSRMQYSNFLGSVRAAAGDMSGLGVFATQTNTGGLIRVDLRYNGHELWLWLSPNNLYVRGFTTRYGTTYQFNDPDYNLFAVMGAIQNGNDDSRNLLPPATGPGVSGPGPRQTLAFGSDYNDMQRAANRPRERMPISLVDLTSSVENLSSTSSPFGGNQQNVARSLMFMIQFVSESARFNDVELVMRNITGIPGFSYNGLPQAQQSLENNWARMSDYLESAARGGRPAPIRIDGIGTLDNTSSVRSHLAMIIGSPGQVSSTGNWDHTEL